MRAVLVFGLQKGVNDPPPLAIPPPRAMFQMMMFPAPPSDPIRAMANKDEDTPGAPGVGVATRTRAKPKKPSMYKEIGRASGRERVGQYVSITLVAVS